MNTIQSNPRFGQLIFAKTQMNNDGSRRCVHGQAPQFINQMIGQLKPFNYLIDGLERAHNVDVVVTADRDMVRYSFIERSPGGLQAGGSVEEHTAWGFLNDGQHRSGGNGFPAVIDNLLLGFNRTLTDKQKGLPGAIVWCLASTFRGTNLADVVQDMVVPNQNWDGFEAYKP